MLSVRGRLEKAHVALIFLLVVLGGSSAGGRVLGMALAFGAFLAFNFFFLPPYLTFAIADPLDWLVLVTFLITSIVAAQLLYRATSTAEVATARAAEVDRLATLGAETLNLARPEDALRAILDVIRTALGVVSCDVLVHGTGDGFVSVARSPAEVSGGEREAGAVRSESSNATGPASVLGWPDTTDTTSAEGLVGWIFVHGRGAVELADGAIRIVDDPPLETARSDRSDEVRALWIPLAVRNETVGVLRVRTPGDLRLTLDQARFLDALAYYVALGVERRRLVAEAERAEAERRVEALRSALLTAVSHDLRTPLTTIKGIANEILNGADRSQAAVIESLIDRVRAAMAMFRKDFPNAAAPDFVVAGGVAANKAIGEALRALSGAEGFSIKIPPPRLCTDNAAMVAWTGVERGQLGIFDSAGVAPKARWPLAPADPA